MASYKRKEVSSVEEKKNPLSVIPPMLRSNFYPPITDPFGSYTGLVKDPDDKPVQDADDL